VALLLQFAWTRAEAELIGEPLFTIVRLDSYTLGPLIEELIKVMPLALLIWLVPNVRRQWSSTDCVLMGAAAGSGFGLAEDLFRFSGAVGRSISVHCGWEIVTGFHHPPFRL
jgi:RsiW-degrading membrane proteinase PrsW (M82 family)